MLIFLGGYIYFVPGCLFKGVRQKENILKSTEVDTYRIEERKSQILDDVVKQYFIGSMPRSLS